MDLTGVRNLSRADVCSNHDFKNDTSQKWPSSAILGGVRNYVTGQYNPHYEHETHTRKTDMFSMFTIWSIRPINCSNSKLHSAVPNPRNLARLALIQEKPIATIFSLLLGICRARGLLSAEPMPKGSEYLVRAINKHMTSNTKSETLRT
jgi:hypothetical protein